MTMSTYQETMRKLYDPENHEVLIASHRGKFSSVSWRIRLLPF